MAPDVEVLVGGHRPVNVMAAHCQLCAGCNRTVWISLAAEELLDRTPATRVVCLACFVRVAEQKTATAKEKVRSRMRTRLPVSAVNSL
jgi:hypothetical protein